ncbi:NAD-dependent epimerase/dehydratase family protein [Nakamurella sp. YIM 132087]|uniref:NAD-dependent epimerase/dehydratase family protein n=1 Tax=Nakamurella alba TaxID=2665158 RepID=A0A7K1FVR9_9ACTN|nr:aldehyde reductase [Nakamurella alba]MTD16914.1 NAD-dependent epimerase/dehydratase family protein [Nakamurella alba]
MTGKVLVTGGSGFIAGHCILQLLAAGRQVRATVRDLAKEPSVRAVLADAGLTDDSALEFVAADLNDDNGWDEAMVGVDVVLHVASPVQPGRVENEDDLILPAREGALRVLRAATRAGIRRVVLTSAFHAVGWGHPHDDRVFTEADWTVPDGPGTDAYGRSKTFAERAAWEFVRQTDGAPELVTLLPVAVMGPVMGRDISGSNHLVQALLTGSMPGLPHLFVPVVDVRDVAAAHVLAMTVPDAAGERFLLSNGPAIEMKDIAATIRSAVGPAGAKVPTRVVPNLVVRIGALFDKQARDIVPDLGYAKRTSNAKARELLGWTPGDPYAAIAAAAESMVRKGLLG